MSGLYIQGFTVYLKAIRKYNIRTLIIRCERMTVDRKMKRKEWTCSKSRMTDISCFFYFFVFVFCFCFCFYCFLFLFCFRCWFCSCKIEFLLMWWVMFALALYTSKLSHQNLTKTTVYIFHTYIFNVRV